MVAKNFTPIDDLIKKYRGISVGLTKEHEPTPIKNTEVTGVQEIAEQKIEEETRPYLQPRAETIELPPDLKKIGLQPASPTQFSRYQNIKLPISDEKIVVGLHAPIASSFRWLATLAVYVLQQAHLGLKTIHGKVVRVFRS